MCRLATRVAGCSFMVMFSAVCAFAAPLDVETYRCSLDGQLRTITLRIHDHARPPECDVRYRKVTELLGHDEILWRASNGLAFCREKALELQTKFAQWGWRCDGLEPSVAVVSPVPSAETLVPGSTRPRESVNAAAVLDEEVDEGPEEVIELTAVRLRSLLVEGFGRGRVHVPGDLLAAGDLNSDGRTDAIATYILEPSGGGVHWVLGVFLREAGSGYRSQVLYPLARHGWPQGVRIEGGQILVMSAGAARKSSGSSRLSVLSLKDGRIVVRESP